MAYTRWNESGHYIFGGNGYVDFTGTVVDDEEVDVFICKLYGYIKDGDNEFWERFHHGNRVIDNFGRGVSVKMYNKHSHELDLVVAEISKIAAEIWLEHFTPIIGLEQVEYMLAKFQTTDIILTDIKKKDFVYFTAKHIKQEKLVAYAACKPEDGYLSLNKICVHKDYRRNGIARGLLDETAALCRSEYGFNKIRFNVNKNDADAVAAFHKMGFITIDSVKTDINNGFIMDDYVMELTVDPIELTNKFFFDLS